MFQLILAPARAKFGMGTSNLFSWLYRHSYTFAVNTQELMFTLGLNYYSPHCLCKVQFTGMHSP